MNSRFATKEIPAELMVAILNIDPTKLNITKTTTKRPKRGYTVSKLKTVRG